MACVRLILGDQINESHSWFRQVDERVLYVMMEVRSETDYVRHHAQKVIGIFAAMRCLAERLGKAGHRVRYFKIGDKDNQHAFADNLRSVFKEVKASRFEYQQPDEYRVDEALDSFARSCGLPFAMQTSERNGEVIGALLVSDNDELMIITDGGTLVRTRVAEISVVGRSAQGVRVIRLDEGEKVVGVDRIAGLPDDELNATDDFISDDDSENPIIHDINDDEIIDNSQDD